MSGWFLLASAFVQYQRKIKLLKKKIKKSAETFIQCGDFYPRGEFYPVWRLLSSAETFIQCGDFYPVWSGLSSMKTFIQFEDFFL